MINKSQLFIELEAWNDFLRRRVHLIACGGTAMTLLGIKESTKDIDFVVPVLLDYNYLTSILKEIGYSSDGMHFISTSGLIYDLFRGNSVFTTELLESPLEKDNNILIREWNNIYLGCLNYYDLIITKLFRGTIVDYRDVYLLFQEIHEEIDIDELINRYRETASNDVSEEKVMNHLKIFINEIKERGYYEK